MRLSAPTLANIFFGFVIDCFMFGKLAARRDIGSELVGMQRALARGIGNESGAEAVAGQVLDLDGTRAPAAFYEGHDLHLLAALRADPAVVVHEDPFGGLGCAVKGFVGLDNLALAAERAVTVGAAVHGFPDPVRHEPSTAVGAKADCPHQLMGGETFFRRGVEPEAEHPFVKRNVAAL